MQRYIVTFRDETDNQYDSMFWADNFAHAEEQAHDEHKSAMNDVYDIVSIVKVHS